MSEITELRALGVKQLRDRLEALEEELALTRTLLRRRERLDESRERVRQACEAVGLAQPHGGQVG